MSTVTTDDVSALLGRDLTTAEDDRAGRLLDIAEGAVEAALPGFSFAAGTETVPVAWHDPDVLWTPKYPVTAINGLTIGGGPVDLTWLRWSDKGKIELIGSQSPWMVNRSWLASAWPTVTIDYDYGTDPAPPMLAGVVASMVATILRRQATNPGNLQAETIGSYSVRYGNQDQAAEEKTAATAGMPLPVLPNRWKRTAAVSVPLSRQR